MNQTKAQTRHTDSLTSDLRGYGLDPREWTVRPLRVRGLFSLDHIKTESFRMLGRAEIGRNRPQWLWLRLTSL